MTEQPATANRRSRRNGNNASAITPVASVTALMTYVPWTADGKNHSTVKYDEVFEQSASVLLDPLAEAGDENYPLFLRREFYLTLASVRKALRDAGVKKMPASARVTVEFF